MTEEGFVYVGQLMITKAQLDIEKGPDATCLEPTLDIVLLNVLETQEIIVLKERKRRINEKDKLKENNLKYFLMKSSKVLQ